ncbi:MAG TPA: teichoic acid ABC transporter permease [Lachnospiraceae bacterium]|nr:teichoic acid ABC transporter permease [Lachnospiraceae bacterium]
MELIKDLYRNRRLILKLSKNDFKTRYAGSYLGIVWAFVQPVVTILVYWFVFEKGLKSTPSTLEDGTAIPFVLMLTSGLVPWFFFSEALNNGTNALIEYKYLVQKVVFKISVLPIIKIMSALYVHLFFVVFTIILFAAYGHMPDLYSLQVIYYSFCMFVLVLALCYSTSAIVVFFKDLTQIINIILQIGMWATPILWQLSIITNPILVMVFKVNPVYYIVQGYRDALIYKVWFWQEWKMTLWFWFCVLILMLIGTKVFKRLKPHFADVL